MAAMWASIVCLQATRLEDALDRFHEAWTDDQFRKDIEDAGSPAEWADVAANSYTESLTPEDITTLAADKYFFLLAARQLLKFIDLLPRDNLPRFKDAKLMRLLRDLEDHWENPGGKAARELRKSIPDIAPGRIEYTKKDISFEGVSLLNILRWAESVDEKVREIATAKGTPIPGDICRSGGSRNLFHRLRESGG
ncbi:hypothetical protein [Longimycelium tulufanense]|nr:hypothetical protein [Longimycelium tulufanense]